MTNFTVSSKFSSPQSSWKTKTVLDEKNNSTLTKSKCGLNFLKKKATKISSEALPVVTGNDLLPKEANKITYAGSQSVPIKNLKTFKRKSIEPQITKSPSRKLSKQCLNETYTLEKITANNNNKNIIENIVNVSFNETTFDDSDKDPIFAVGKF